MLTLIQSGPAAQPEAPGYDLENINRVKITGHQLDTALHLRGAGGEDRLSVFTDYAKAEGIEPLEHAAEALMLRIELACDFLDGAGPEDDDWKNKLEAIARVKLVDNEDARPVGESGVCFDQVQFDELLLFIREIPW